MKATVQPLGKGFIVEIRHPDNDLSISICGSVRECHEFLTSHGVTKEQITLLPED